MWRWINNYSLSVDPRSIWDMADMCNAHSYDRNCKLLVGTKLPSRVWSFFSAQPSIWKCFTATWYETLTFLLCNHLILNRLVKLRLAIPWEWENVIWISMLMGIRLSLCVQLNATKQPKSLRQNESLHNTPNGQITNSTFWLVFWCSG